MNHYFTYINHKKQTNIYVTVIQHPNKNTYITDRYVNILWFVSVKGQCVIDFQLFSVFFLIFYEKPLFSGQLTELSLS